MIEAIAKIGELELLKIKESGGNELNLLIDKPFKYNEKKKQEVIVLNMTLTNNKLLFNDIETEYYFSLSGDWKLLYKQGSSNGNDFSLTTRYNGDFDKFSKRFERNIASFGFELSRDFMILLKEQLKNYSLKDNVLVTIKIDGKYLGEISAIVSKFYENLYKTFKNIDGKIKTRNGVSYMSNVNKEVFGGGMSASFSFYTIDKPGFAYGLIKENSVKMLPLSSEESKNLIAGKNCLDANFIYTYARQRFYLIPNFYYNENEKIIKTFSKLSKLQDLKSDTYEIAGKEDTILSELSKNKDYVSFNLLFFKPENSALRILRLIEDVLPSRISSILESIDKTNKTILKYDLTNKYWTSVCFEQKIIYDLFSDNNSNEIFFEILDAIFKKKEINNNFLLHMFLKKIRLSLHPISMQKGIYRQTIECFIIYLTFKNLGILREESNNIKINNSKNGGIIMDNKYTQSFEAVFQNYDKVFVKPETRYLFSLGFLISRVVAKQRNSLGSSPILNNLKGLKLRKKDIPRLKISVEAKARDYKISSIAFESVDNYFLIVNNSIETWNITDDEINFFICLGINMNKCVWEELKKKGKKVPDEVEELEVQ